MLVQWLASSKEYFFIFRLIGPPSDYALSLLFQNSKKDSIYGKLYQNNMEGLKSFYKDRVALEQLVKSGKVAFVQAGDMINFHEDYHCKVKHLSHLNLHMSFQFQLFFFSDIFCLERSCASFYFFYVYGKTVATYTVHSTWNKEDGRIRNHKPSYQETCCI